MKQCHCRRPGWNRGTGGSVGTLWSLRSNRPIPFGVIKEVGEGIGCLVGVSYC